MPRIDKIASRPTLRFKHRVQGPRKGTGTCQVIRQRQPHPRAALKNAPAEPLRVSLSAFVPQDITTTESLPAHRVTVRAREE